MKGSDRILLTLMALTVIALSGLLVWRTEAFRAGDAYAGAERLCSSGQHARCQELINACHRGRDRAACDSLMRASTAVASLVPKIRSVRNRALAGKDAAHPIHAAIDQRER